MKFEIQTAQTLAWIWHVLGVFCCGFALLRVSWRSLKASGKNKPQDKNSKKQFLSVDVNNRNKLICTTILFCVVWTPGGDFTLTYESKKTIRIYSYVNTNIRKTHESPRTSNIPPIKNERITPRACPKADLKADYWDWLRLCTYTPPLQMNSWDVWF